MKLFREDFDWAVSEELISAEQGDALWMAFEERIQDRPAFDLIHIVYYFGALIVIAAMTWFMTEAWDRFGGGGIFLISTVYACFFVLAGRHFWHKPGFKIPGGLLFTLAVCMTPLVIYGLQRFTGIWPQADPGITQWYFLEPKDCRLLMEAGTVVAGLIALRFVRFPFLAAPIVISLWGMSLDLALFLLGKPELSEPDQKWISVWFGLAVLLVAYLIDQRTKEDYAFWVYLLGLAAFWGGLTSMESDSELGKFIYCMINVGLMFLSVLLARRAFILFGALGVFVYLGHLADKVFKDSLLFPFALTVLGIAIIYLGTQYQRHRDAIERSIVGLIPTSLRRLLPQERVRG